MTPSTQYAISTEPRTPSPWWLELILVDFRHALWPWLIYCASIFGIAITMTEDKPSFAVGTFIVAIMLSAPAAITATLTADFSHATSSALLAFPINRIRIWLVRLGFMALLLILPFIVGLMGTFWNYDSTSDLPKVQLYVQMAFFVFCYFCIGALFSVVLRKTLVAWSATFVSPLILLVVYLFLQNLFNIRWGLYATPGFPWMPLAYPLFASVVSLLLLIVAFFQWKRLEVRS